jgi:hypothetical protein
VGGEQERRGWDSYCCKKNKDLYVLAESDITWQEEIAGKIRERPNAYSHFFHRLGLAPRERNSL